MDIQRLISEMTLEEKASLMSGKNFWETVDIERLGIPSMLLADGPHGIRKQMKSADHLGLNESIKATCFPTAATMANSWNTDLVEVTAAALGQEAAAQGVNVVLGPGINLKRNPLCGRNFEYFSEDPYLVGKMGAAVVRGIQQNGIAACVKHFAANNQEERRMVIDSVVDERTLRELYLTAFEIAIKEGHAKSIMTSYNKVNGIYANENPHLLKEILRDEWGFDGVVVTDWGGCNDRIEGLKAGNELEMPTTGGETNREIVEAVNTGRLDEAVLDAAVERLLTLIFDTDAALKAGEHKFDEESHHMVAMQAAEESVVLLKNINQTLPIPAGTRVAVIGDFAQNPRYQGAGSSVVNPTRLDNSVEGMGLYDFVCVGYEPGFDRHGRRSNSLIKKACLLAESSELVLLYLGLDEFSELEGADRAHMQLPKNQLELLTALKKTGAKIVAILSCGAPVEMGWADDCAAVVHGYLGGQAGARAVLNILAGKVNPSGKLAESYPVYYENCPSARYFHDNAHAAEYREGLFIGYRYYDACRASVKYPFGFGLSYTTFTYSDLSVNDTGVSFRISNTGEYDGAEIAQLYVAAGKSKVFRPTKELKGFVKVHLHAGESVMVTIPFDEYTFRFFNTKSNRWDIERCTYTLMIGASSVDIRLTTSYCTGEDIETSVNPIRLPSYYVGKVSNVKREEFEKLCDRPVPKATYQFFRRCRIVVGPNTSVSDLRYAKGWTGRFFAWGIRFAYRFLLLTGNRQTANVLMIALYHMPLRGISRMTGGAISWGQLESLLTMFNGHLLKGIRMFLSAGRTKKKRIKQEKRNKKCPRCSG